MSRMYVTVIVNITGGNLDRGFTYGVPQHLRERAVPGAVVEIPFGAGNKVRDGYIIGIVPTPEYDPEKIKDILDVKLKYPGGEQNMIALAAWMKNRYGSPMIQALKTTMPIRQQVRPVENKEIHLLLSREDAIAAMETAGRKKQKARQRLYEALLEKEDGVLSLREARNRLCISMDTVKRLEEKQAVKVTTAVDYRNPLTDSIRNRFSQESVVLNDIQKKTVEGILALPEGCPALIHGVTGCGKTEIYMELIARTLAESRQAILLIPEISLTFQTVARFYRRFSDQVSILHSRLSKGEKQDQIQRAVNGEVQVMIGPRSALFTPFPNLGMIIIDEEHEESYHSETTPRYHADEVALWRGQAEQARVVFGSATPSLKSYYRARSGTYALFPIRERVAKRPMPKVEIVDMRQELKEGNRLPFSRLLIEQLRDCLSRKEQAILFLNRRGYASFVTCRSCGYVAKCPHCDISLTIHRDGKVRCHTCGYETVLDGRCPSCHSGHLKGMRAGTQQLENMLKTVFPMARVLRMDQDTTKGKEGHEEILASFGAYEADILLGTQMIVKGHDFPKVTLVGALSADLSLFEEDYKSAERTFDLLTQAAGRAGRGEREGMVVIQTYNPEHYAIVSAGNQNYEEFYEQEIAYRSFLNYPPCGGMMQITVSGPDEAYTDLAAGYLKRFLDSLCRKVRGTAMGPATPSVAKVKDRFLRTITVKAEDPKKLNWVKNQMERYIEINEGFKKLLISFDVE